MDFFVLLNDEDADDTGAYLGIPTGIVIVKLDTLTDVEFKYVNGNHVDFDSESILFHYSSIFNLVKILMFH